MQHKRPVGTLVEDLCAFDVESVKLKSFVHHYPGLRLQRRFLDYLIALAQLRCIGDVQLLSSTAKAAML
jgi:hypothetical protein